MILIPVTQLSPSLGSVSIPPQHRPLRPLPPMTHRPQRVTRFHASTGQKKKKYKTQTTHKPPSPFSPCSSSLPTCNFFHEPVPHEAGETTPKRQQVGSHAVPQRGGTLPIAALIGPLAQRDQRRRSRGQQT